MPNTNTTSRSEVSGRSIIRPKDSRLGIAGAAFGYSQFMLELGAGLYQFKDYFLKDSPLGGPADKFDDEKDNYMIRSGIKYFNEKLQNE